MFEGTDLVLSQGHRFDSCQRAYSCIFRRAVPGSSLGVKNTCGSGFISLKN